MKSVTDPAQLARFRAEWEKYLKDIKAPGPGGVGADLDVETIRSMSEGQKRKLVDMRTSSLDRDADGNVVPNFTPTR